MAVTDAYATASQYRARVKKHSTDDNEVIDEQLLAVSRYLDRQYGRHFTQDAAAVARIFTIGEYGTGNDGARSFSTPDIAVAPTSVLVDWDADGDFSDETALAATDYELLPLDAQLGPEPEPFTRIRLTTFGEFTTFPIGHRVQITAQWGWPAVPKSITEATIALTSILRLEGPRSTNRISDGVEGAVEASPAAQTIVRSLVKSYGRMVYA